MVQESFMPVDKKIPTETTSKDLVEEDADDSEEENDEEEVVEIPAVTKIAYVTTDGSGDDSDNAVTMASIYDEDENYGNSFKSLK